MREEREREEREKAAPECASPLTVYTPSASAATLRPTPKGQLCGSDRAGAVAGRGVSLLGALQTGDTLVVITGKSVTRGSSTRGIVGICIISRALRIEARASSSAAAKACVRTSSTTRQQRMSARRSSGVSICDFVLVKQVNWVYQ